MSEDNKIQVRQRILTEEIKRFFIESKILRVTLVELTKNSVLQEYRDTAKKNGNKQFKDLIKISAEYVRYMDSMTGKVKECCSPTTWNIIQRDLATDYVKDIHVLIEMVSKLPDAVVQDEVIPYIEQLIQKQKNN